jgi:hypothetical protein
MDGSTREQEKKHPKNAKKRVVNKKNARNPAAGFAAARLPQNGPAFFRLSLVTAAASSKNFEAFPKLQFFGLAPSIEAVPKLQFLEQLP